MSETILICRIRRCTAPARWILIIAGHPNGDPPPCAYCHEHAQERSKLLWDESPRPYRTQADGPYTPAELRRALGPDGTAESLAAKRQQLADLATKEITATRQDIAAKQLAANRERAREREL